MNVLFHLLSHVKTYVKKCTKPQYNGFICCEESCHAYALFDQSAIDYIH